jgi:hypothetical protein
VDSAEEIQKSSLNDTQDSDEPLEEVLSILGDIAAEIESGAEVKMKHPSDFYYSAAQEVIELKARINELEIMLDGAKKGVERYVFGKLEITDEQGEVITVLDEWVSRELIEGAISTYVIKGIIKGTEYLENN